MTRHYLVTVAPSKTIPTRTDKCVTCGDETYWSDDPDPVCKTCASDPEELAHKLADARAELRETRAALEAETQRADAAELAHETDCGQLRAALEQARALLLKIQFWGDGDRCPVCNGGPGNVEFYHTPDCKLAALLAAGSGGAVIVAPPICDFCKIQNGIQAAMDIVETLPDVGEHYDDMVTKAFDALDDAYGWHRHEHGSGGAA